MKHRKSQDMHPVGTLFEKVTSKHNKMKQLILISLSLLMVGCAGRKNISVETLTESPKKELAVTERILLVNNRKVDCQGVAPMKCFEIKEVVEGVIPEVWTMFYDQIQGFDYEPGYVYKLRVNTTKLPRKDVPADASNLKHELVEVLEKTLAEFSPIEGSWKVVSIRNVESKTVSKAGPFMTLSQGRVSGSDGCNRYFSSYNEDGISINFTAFGSTKMACMGEGLQEVSSALFKAFEATTSFKLNGNTLSFLDKNQAEVIRFEKEK